MPQSFLFYFALIFLVVAAVMWGMAAQAGLNPLAPELTWITLAAFVTALYIAARISLVIRKRQRRSVAEAEAEGRPVGSADKPPGSPGSIEDRMAARRARVEAAKAKAAKAREG